MLRCSLLTALLAWACSVFAVAQKLVVEEFRVRVVTQEGHHARGILDEVSEDFLYVDYVAGRSHYRSEKILLADIRKVIVRSNKRKTLEGAIVGGGILTFLSIDSSKRNGFRSPVLLGLNVLLATAVGAAAGALVGKNVGPIGHKTIRPFGRTPNEMANSLRLQLEPFSLANQSNILNRVSQ